MPTPFTRSLVQRAVSDARRVVDHFGFHLPEFGSWSPEQWEAAGPEWNPVRERMLGWDVTDFGSGSFHEIGRGLFTLRNGSAGNIANRVYAEKLLIDPEGQRAPAHFHRSKCEDIVCRCGGNILVQLTATDPEGNPARGRLAVELDGAVRTIASGETVRLTPGRSVTIPPRTIHQFWGEEETGWRMDGIGYTLSSEISSTCDDWNDNVFLAAAERFPSLQEDEARRLYLCHEYPKATFREAPLQETPLHSVGA